VSLIKRGRSHDVITLDKKAKEVCRSEYDVCIAYNKGVVIDYDSFEFGWIFGNLHAIMFGKLK